MKIKVTVHEGKPPVEIGDTENVNAVISSSSKEARSKGMLNIIFIEVDNGNCIHFVVGGDETVLGFVYGHQNPPYYASKENNLITRVKRTMKMIIR